MAPLTYQPEFSVRPQPPRVRLEPVRFHHTLMDGSWWPSTSDLERELSVLVPMLDDVCGPVAKLLVSVGGWTARPHHITGPGRTVGVGYLAGQSPFMMTVLCTDGDTFTLRVVPPDPGSGVPDRSAAEFTVTRGPLGR